ncbi:MAG: AAA family ATPase [Cytophagales bacterium]|nr:AAA family ATPase [Cytophagales bacterium]
MKKIYPFSGVLAQEDLKLCLLLNLIDFRLGGVLIRGEKGTGKTTAVRALSRISDLSRPFVDLPLGVDESRLLGGLSLEPLLNEKKKILQKGLLQQAHQGILYVDEINLLPDALADLLLDATASGGYFLEREGLSQWCPSSFCLVGTMNPEEGEPRSQLVDRFALSVEVQAPQDLSIRTQIIARKIQFEEDPENFMQEEEKKLKQRIISAQNLLNKVEIPPPMMEKASQLCLDKNIGSLRADIRLVKAARAYAAYMNEKVVLPTHVEKVAAFVLNHRQKEHDISPPLSGRSQHSPEDNTQGSGKQGQAPAQGNTDEDAGMNETSPKNSQGKIGKEKEWTSHPSTSTTHKPGLLRFKPTHMGRKKTIFSSFSTQKRPSFLGPEIAAKTDWIRTLSHFLLLGIKQRFYLPVKRSIRIIWLIDQSGSMGKDQQLSRVQTLLRGSLKTYLGSSVSHALIGLERGTARLLQGFGDHKSLLRCLESLRGGGRTHLLAGFRIVSEVLSRHRMPWTQLFLFTDGKVNQGSQNSFLSPRQEAITFYKTYLRNRLFANLIDTEMGFIRLGMAKSLAKDLGMKYLSLG